ncbi:hypothetical protein [Pontibacter ruber]|uniref:Uncharacterized protein n=1 Tax=Pontibacter ruber TaxID=1343895 RepID=A0ABW5CRF9_9BACT|nr:hypothetical protein [Pontibacter ruber]
MYKQVYLIENTGITDQPSFAGTLPSDSLQVLYPNKVLVEQFGPIRLYKLK